MIYKLKPVEDALVEKACSEGINKLETFFDFKWSRNRPSIFIVNDRKTIDKLKGEKTPRWLVAWARNGNVYLLDKTNFEKESNHKYSDIEYESLIKHEICHIYYAYISENFVKPFWLSEGLSIFLSDQIKLRKRPEKLQEFLDFYETASIGEKTVYKEAGFAVEWLTKNYGKEKLIKLIKESKNYSSKQGFDKLFEQIYGFKLSYEKLSY